jgi:predicted cation transporter
MKTRLSILLGLTPFLAFAEGQHGMVEWIEMMTIQSLLFYAFTIGLLVTIIDGILRRQISKRRTLIFFGIGLGTSIVCLIVAALIDVEMAYPIPYLMFLDLIK